MNWYKHYLGDYARDTTHLSVTEHGAYRLLIDHYYALRKPLPDDFAYLCRVARCHSRHEKSCLRTVLKTFFVSINHQVMHARIDKEILKYQETVDAARIAAAMRWQSEPISPPEVRSQKLEESKSKATSIPLASSPNGLSAGVNGKSVAYIPLVDGTEFGLSEADLDELKKAYPALDCKQTMLEIRAWCVANPTRKKTRRGAMRFINSWMARLQDRAH
jgi:uncharacterized protein YdaU (DUF1376 family)